MKRPTLVFALLLPGIAAAEVSDKIPTIPFLLAQGAVLAAIALALGWVRWWLALIFLPVGALMFSGTADLWQEPYMREAILNEQGHEYFVFEIVAAFLVLCGSVGGVALGIKRKTPGNPPRPTSAPMRHRV